MALIVRHQHGAARCAARDRAEHLNRGKLPRRIGIAAARWLCESGPFDFVTTTVSFCYVNCTVKGNARARAHANVRNFSSFAQRDSLNHSLVETLRWPPDPLGALALVCWRHFYAGKHMTGRRTVKENERVGEARKRENVELNSGGKRKGSSARCDDKRDGKGGRGKEVARRYVEATSASLYISRAGGPDLYA